MGEGKVNWPREDLRLKWGVGRLVADCQARKLMVLPVYHHGMAQVLPNPLSKGESQPCAPACKVEGVRDGGGGGEVQVDQGGAVSLGGVGKRDEDAACERF